MSDLLQEQLIELLSDGKFHSGETLGEQLGISRAAIGKRISRLNDDWGINYHAVSGKGYKLTDVITLLNKDIIAQHSQSKKIVEHLDLHKSLDSTNDYLLTIDSIEKGKVNACATEYQTQGKGRRGRQWLSPFGQNIYMSMSVMLEIPMYQLSGLSLAVGVSLVRELESIGYYGLSLKWPNDLLFEGKKLGGILVEVKGEAEGPVYVVVGIGINVSSKSLPDHFENNAISSLEEVNNQIHKDRNLLVARIFDRLLEMLQQYPDTGLAECENHWSDYDAYKNKVVILSNVSKTIEGICKGINGDGALLLEINGVLKSFNGGELSLRAK